MGTFHPDAHALHGITLAVETDGAVIVGRCDDMDAERLVLRDAEVHHEGDGGRSNAEWLRRAAAFGVTPRHARLELSLAEVRDFGPLSERYEGVGRMRTVPQPAAAPEPPAPAPSAEAVVALTESARAEVRRILAEDGSGDKGLRLSVTGGGCSGLVYKVELDERREGDVVQAEPGFQVLLDRKSTIYLRGVGLDYRGGLEGRGFAFSNPNAVNTCGCGESFSV